MAKTVPTMDRMPSVALIWEVIVMSFVDQKCVMIVFRGVYCTHKVIVSAMLDNRLNVLLLIVIVREWELILVMATLDFLNYLFCSVWFIE